MIKTVYGKKTLSIHNIESLYDSIYDVCVHVCNIYRSERAQLHSLKSENVSRSQSSLYLLSNGTNRVCVCVY